MPVHKANPSDNRILTVQHNDLIEVELEENPTTGYRWEIVNINDEELELIKSEYRMFDDAGIGGGGKRYITLKVKNPGHGKVELLNRQKWSGEVEGRFVVRYDRNNF